MLGDGRRILGATPSRALAGVGIAIACVGLAGCEPANLALDTAYGDDGVADIPEQDSFMSPHAFEVAEDGSIVTVLDGRLTRIGTDGTVDPSFGANAPTDGSVRAAAVDGSGRVLTLGGGSSEDQVVVHRFTAAGSPDPSFDGDGARTIAMSFRSTPADVQVDHAGRIVVFFENEPEPGPDSACEVVRLLPDGAVDTGFGGGLPVAVDLPYSISTGAQCNELLVLDDDSLLAVDIDAGIARLSPTGAALPYGSGPAAFMADSYDGIRDAALLPGGRVALGSSNYDGGYRMMVGELTAAGELDPAFGIGGIAKVGFVDLSAAPNNLEYTRLAWLSATPGGSLIAVGGADGVAVARWIDGHIDTGFASGGRLLVDDPLPYPRDLDTPITAGVASNGTLYVICNRQGALAPLTLVHLTAA
jgi:uncharacterized delta-60 repeat protein